MSTDGKPPEPADPEEALVRGLQARDEAAVETFLERYRPVFQHCIAQFEAEPAARDDLFQEVTLAVLDSLGRDRFDPAKGSFGSWVYRVAWCRCVDLKRKQTARSHVQAGLEDDLPERVDDQADPGRSAGEAEVAELVRGAMRELPDEERRLLELRYLRGRTLVGVARELGLSVETAKYRVKRASASLRKQLSTRLARAENLE